MNDERTRDMFKGVKKDGWENFERAMNNFASNCRCYYMFKCVSGVRKVECEKCTNTNKENNNE